MKTIEEKANAYDKALERAKVILNDYEERGLEEILFYAKEDLGGIFPELKESEDEKVRRCLINGMKFYYEGNEGATWGTEKFSMKVKDILSWLEKQGEQKAADKVEPKFKVGDIIKFKTKDGYSETWQIIQVDMLDKKYRLKDGYVLHFSEEDAYELVEQKTDDEIEPKFKVGDWILYSGDYYEGVRHITKIDENGYYIERNGLPHGIIPFNHEKCMRLWTIQDAKDGDVLVYRNSATEIIMLFKSWLMDGKVAYTHFHIFDNEYRVNSSCDCGNGAHPATKEQRDLLFQKMKEAGYEWDTEKKELKEPQRMISAEAKEALYDKPAWSEEDETGWTNTMIMIKEGASNHYTKDSIKLVIDWLKSIKERVQPKQEWSVDDRSKVQRICEYLDEAKKYYANITEVRECIDWLKSLKERIGGE